MLEKIKQIAGWFGKGDEDLAMQLPLDAVSTFELTIDDLMIGELHCENGEWKFKYSEEFKQNDDYKHIIGFPDLGKTYTKSVLWPFFRIRIPGLKQAAVQEILKEENIDIENEFELLKRFGRKTIANPYILELATSDKKEAVLSE